MFEVPAFICVEPTSTDIHYKSTAMTRTVRREEFTERAAAFYVLLGQGAPVDENDPFADLEPDIFEEERNEIVVHED